MTLPLILSGSGHPPLGAALAHELDGKAACNINRSPDGELHVAVEGVQSRDVFVVQPLAAPIGEACAAL